MNQELKQILVSVIVPELHLLKIEREIMSGHAMEFDQPFFRKGPEPFQGIDVDFASSESFPMINPEMPISTEHQRVVAFKPVGVDNTPSAHRLYRQTQKGPCTHISYYFNPNLSSSLYDAEYRGFPPCTSSTPAFPSSTKVGLICLNFSLQQLPVFTVSQDRRTNTLITTKDRGVTDSYLPGCLSGRDFQLKEFDYVQPVLLAYSQPIDPSSREVMECIAASFTSLAPCSESIDFIPLTPYAETTVLFPTCFLEVFAGT